MEHLGTFSENLKNYLSEYRGRSGASRQSDRDIKSVGLKTQGYLENGKMYSFEYYASTASFYDSNPIVIGLGGSDHGQELGINLHYIPYNMRVSFLEDLTKSLHSYIKVQLRGPRRGNPLLQAPISYLNWDNLKSTYQKKYNLKNAIKQYDISNMSKVRVLGYEHWYLGAVHNENYFIGGTIGQAQSLYYKNI